MKYKKSIIVAIIFIVAFIGITIVKYGGNSINTSTAVDTIKSDSIQQFWFYYNTASDFRLQGAADSAFRYYQEALNINPKHEDALYYIGNMFMNSDKNELALSSWNKLTEINPQSERAFIQLGNLYFSINKPAYFHPEKSKSYFEKAANLNKETLSPNLKLGEIALFQNHTNEAFDIFNKLSIMDQKNAEIYFIIGYLNWQSGNEMNAIKNLDRTFEIGIAASAITEQGEKTNAIKTESIIKKKDSNLFMNWLVENLLVIKKHDTKTEMPKVYQNFDQYLNSYRKQLNNK